MQTNFPGTLKQPNEYDFYTSYLGNPRLKNEYKDKIKVIITRQAPGKMSPAFRARYEPALAPEWQTISNFKVTGNVGWMSQAYQCKLDALRRVRENTLQGLEKFIKANPGIIVFVCYCKDHNKCHRKVLAEDIQKHTKMTWSEL